MRHYTSRRRHLELEGHVLGALAGASATEGKVERRLNAGSFPEEANIPAGSQDDVEIVRLVVETRAILVTTDHALISDLKLSSVMDTYNLRLMSPEEALDSM